MRFLPQILSLIVPLSVVALHAQDGGRILARTGSVTISTKPVGAEVYLDNVFLGRAPLEAVAVETGSHVISCFFPSRRDWNASAVLETLQVLQDSSLRREYILPQVFMVRSIPSGVSVRSGDSVVGTTPVELMNSGMTLPIWLAVGELPDTLMIETTREGFRAAIARLPQRTPLLEGVSPPIMSENRLRSWSVFGALGMGAVSGVLAAHWKVQANQAAEAFRFSQAQGDRDAMHRYDARSGIAFAITQVSLGVLTYLLLTAD